MTLVSKGDMQYVSGHRYQLPVTLGSGMIIDNGAQINQIIKNSIFRLEEKHKICKRYVPHVNIENMFVTNINTKKKSHRLDNGNLCRQIPTKVQYLVTHSSAYLSTMYTYLM